MDTIADAIAAAVTGVGGVRVVICAAGSDTTSADVRARMERGSIAAPDTTVAVGHALAAVFGVP